jgi:hypothetical protein
MLAAARGLELAAGQARHRCSRRRSFIHVKKDTDRWTPHQDELAAALASFTEAATATPTMTTAPWASVQSIFADLPLWEFVDSLHGQGPSHQLTTDQLGARACLKYISANKLVAAAECSQEAEMLWHYDPRSLTFQSSRDTSVCLDIFDGAVLGAYWCHNGINQRFGSAPSKQDGRVRYCSPYDDRFCISLMSEENGPTVAETDPMRPLDPV